MGHIPLSSSLAKTVLHGTVKGKEEEVDKKERWKVIIKEWTEIDFAG